jgi:hypothetical protein
VDRAPDRDAASASAEYLAQFRTDVESFISREAVEACVAVGVRERAPLPDADYMAFVDPSGGSADSMTLAIGHKEGDVVVIDALRERKPPFSPDAVVDEFAALLKSYRVMKVSGDKYAGMWPRERFEARNVTYEPAETPKSDLYRDMLPLLNAKRLDLLDDRKLVAQLCGLERRTTRAGKDSIDHAPGGHDDLVNVVAGVASVLGSESWYWRNNMAWVSDGTDIDPRPSLYQHPMFFGGLPPWVVR